MSFSYISFYPIVVLCYTSSIHLSSYLIFLQNSSIPPSSYPLLQPFSLSHSSIPHVNLVTLSYLFLLDQNKSSQDIQPKGHYEPLGSYLLLFFTGFRSIVSRYLSQGGITRFGLLPTAYILLYEIQSYQYSHSN